jgi:hypothetical protein
MNQESPSPIGTVAQEAARLIEDMATMARRNHSGDHTSRYAGEPAQESCSPQPQDRAAQPQDREIQNPGLQVGAAQGREGESQKGLGHEGVGHEGLGQERQGSEATDNPSDGACSQCGAQPGDTRADDIPSSCQLCPLCRGIGLLRSVRPETVDLLADLAMAVAAGLRDLALWSRASEPGSPATSSPGSPDPDRAPVQDIPVGDESEG